MKIIILLALISLNLYSNLYQGWNLVGINQNTTFKEIISNNENITNIYAYKDNVWYSFKGDKNISLSSSDGVWVYSTKQADRMFFIKKEENSKKTILLKKGWNLKSLPINKTISSFLLKKEIFRFNGQRWLSFNDSKKEIVKILPNDGIWIYSKKDDSISITENKLIKSEFKNQKEVEEYIERIIIENRQFTYDYSNTPYPVNLDTASAKSGGAPAAESSVVATATNTQEKEVDEIDVIKHNNKQIFFINNGKVFLTSFDDIILNKKAKESIELKNNKQDIIQAEGLYLYNNKLVIFSKQNNRFYTKGIKSKSIMPYYNREEISYIDIYDIEQDNFSNKLSHIQVDGYIKTSRVIKNKLYIVNSFYPNFKVKYDNTDNCYGNIEIYSVNCTNPLKKDYEILSKQTLPKLVINDKTQDIVLYDNFYINSVKTNNLNIISLFAIDLDENKATHSTSVDGNIHNVYSSLKYMYLTSTNYNYKNFYDYFLGSKIFTFSLENGISFDGEVNIKGRIKDQFSLSEHNGNLRVATTEGRSWRGDTNNSLYIIKNNEVISSINNLGKKGETIKAVRYFGDRAFVVTFKQTDPLYILDLSDINKPKKISELEIPGYSTYFHYIDEDNLLSIGRDADEKGRQQGIQLQLFDISNLNNPKLADKLVIGNNRGYSSALYNHKAFTYFNQDKLLSIDYSDNSFRGFKVFKISNKIKLVQDIKREGNRYYGNGNSIIFKINNKNYMAYINDDSIITEGIK